ncbi:CaiB/BaiF CoA transferase family protein [Microbacterium murale]|uniref:Crotonobetainyl-CoA:carnitine CoA-transferase CaiB-like acyl-CoA transferase n=1 Tax=Microbacterium murale TaxID=1081040 RepID=A0ABU0PBI3_9MICO|nr:CoA transferase [Microbacterium murale]MDQ0644704.1 crotonobetainyl-CoA:carnitine CoA-transferase CaiB-like acyl-CoA transferase [Microbacterium murale]
MSAPLDGVVVADFSRVLAGPLATMTLADLGARVIKIERPGSGDDTRAWGPPYAESGMTTYFESANRGKESIALDLTADADRERAHAIIARSDIVIENFRPGLFERLGFGWDSLSDLHPRLVYVSVSGFGLDEGASLPGYDFVAQAVGGLMHITGEADGEAMKAGVALVDVLTGKDAVIGILAALRRREATGRGSRIDVNLLSSLQAALVNQVSAHLGAGAEPVRLGNRHPSIAPYEVLRCADGPVAVACGNDAQFARLADELGRPELAADPRFLHNPDRVARREDLVAELERALATGTAAAWADRLNLVGVAAGEVNSIGDGIALAERLGLDPLLETLGADGRRSRQIRSPLSWTPRLPVSVAAPPRLGEHDSRVRDWLDGTD